MLRQSWRGPGGLAIAVSLMALIIALAGGLFSAASAQSSDASTLGEWSSVQPWPMIAAHAHLLPTGKVMVHGYTDDERLWDPAVDTISQLALAGYNIFCGGHSLLGDGRLLVTGGHIRNTIGERKATIYNPFTDTWTRQPDMNAGRWYPTNTTLANGDVLVVSGWTESQRLNPLPQVWQASSGQWRDLTGATRVLPAYPFMHAADGKVFNSGPDQSTQYLNTAGSGAWINVGPREFGFRGYGTSVMYDAGKVLVVGGGDPPTATAEIIDLNATSPTWSYATSMANPRRQLNATLLPDGKVVVTGGSSAAGFNTPSGAVYAAEMWDPATNTWSTLASSARYRGYHSTALLLPDGRVLTAGGEPNELNAETFSPPYLFKGSRPTITSASTSVSYNQTFRVETPDAASVARVTWIRLSSVTHSYNMEQRFAALSYSRAAGGLNVMAPASGDLSPPGYYMLFILNGNGVPSVGQIVRIGTGLGLTSPVNGATLYGEARPGLDWADLAGATSYHLQVSTSPSFDTKIVDIDVTGASSYTPTSNLAPGTYYWKVIALGPSGPADWSATWRFTIATGPPPPPAPTLISPGAAGVPPTIDTLRPTFSWTALDGVTLYRIQMSQNAGFTSFAVDATSSTPTFSMPAWQSLTRGAQYWWRVQAENGPWSEVFTFRASDATAAPAVPTLISPATGAVGQSATPTLDWADVPGATSYHLQVATSMSFGTRVVDVEVTDGSAYTPTTVLAAGTTHYWRVNAKNGAGTSANSATWSFTVVPGPAPTLTAPGASGAPPTIDTLRPVYSWTALDGATLYRIQVSPNAGFTSFSTNATSSTLTYSMPTWQSLARGTQYWWRVQDENGGWSEVFTFKTPTLPAAPTLTSPVNGATGQSPTPVLDWADMPGATSYHLQVATSTSFGTRVVDVEVTDGSTYTLTTSLAAGTTHYWRVNAKNGAGTSANSATWSFTVVPGPAPALTSPGAVGVPPTIDTLKPVYSWDAVSGATVYRIQVSPNVGFTSFTTNATSSTPTYSMPTWQSLAKGTQYWWRVQANNGAWSEVFTFRTPAIPTAPTLTGPASGATGQSVTPTLDWADVTGATSYHLQVATSASFGTRVVDVDVTDGSTYTSTTSLAAGTTYYWRVNARNGAGTSANSVTWTFRT